MAISHKGFSILQF